MRPTAPTTPLLWALVAGAFTASGVRSAFEGWLGLGLGFIGFGAVLGAVAGVLQHRVMRSRHD